MNGKGDADRTADKPAFGAGWERTYGPKPKRKRKRRMRGYGPAHPFQGVDMILSAYVKYHGGKRLRPKGSIPLPQMRRGLGRYGVGPRRI